jgi:hypothetical protein
MEGFDASLGKKEIKVSQPDIGTARDGCSMSNPKSDRRSSVFATEALQGDLATA